MSAEAWKRWSEAPQADRERVLLAHGLRPPGHPSRRWWRHPLLALRAARQRRRTTREIWAGVRDL